MKADIRSRTDVEELLRLFYAKARTDERISFFFNELVEIHWETHLPRIADFWESILFGKGNYQGDPMLVHKQLNQKQAIEQKHFDAWLELFCDAVSENFAGEKAEEAKKRAVSIGAIMLLKLNS
jgi:hemoglobin